ncbi:MULTISPECIES: TIGR03747 family integrating conjugative element membrane protein [Yersinia]|jgi:integrating conjugative element membrane protein (TIGR03747 family)|uniref:TIGR03747 family integrating conjugative element membrane protein n=1 Tax=Yersinia TaxID=629 RepID=UPI00065CF18A|nr:MULTISPECIES: TIGR03747 family integrating conjugative element membrane protein [Yersinia]UYK10042.1 TIGR03747 family integrating conjugative element membrane protein [Yersinia enterocolitica]CRY82369.1 putative inner membrane protein [Yersinia intermedia]HDL7969635.1 TIGR03747 family integrating conjugative element membrane protein [Yersinia enterocolitica]HDY4892077.1 TIGR03747 family integrating conjugative element membrane protein [Yersinia enterocolitica]
MAQASSSAQPVQQNLPPKRHGLLMTVLWDMPWRIIGMLLVSLLFSLIVEYIGIAFFWPELGAEHSRAVMVTESGYFAEGFTRSLLLSAPVTTVSTWITVGYQWLFVNSGFMAWLQSAQTQHTGNAITDSLNVGGAWLIQVAREYLMASMYVTLVFLMRVTILVLSVPLFVLVALVGIVDGMVRRDLRRYGAGYESSFLYHHAKRFVKPAVYIPCILYLSAPFSVYPNLLLLPAALLMGLAISVTMGSFKKYL